MVLFPNGQRAQSASVFAWDLRGGLVVGSEGSRRTEFDRFGSEATRVVRPVDECNGSAPTAEDIHLCLGSS